MPKFKYKARDINGNLYKSIIVAENEAQARENLAEKGFWVLDIRNADERKSALDFDLNTLLQRFNHVTLRDQVIFCRQFSALVNAGVAMMRTLSILAGQSENPKFAKIIGAVKTDVEQGLNLSDAFAKFPDIFDTLFISMIRAGETGGVLDEVLNRIAKFMEDRAKLTAKVKSAMTYPTVVSALASIIFFVMLTVILPKFGDIFARLGSDLPAYTKFLISISNVLRSPWIILIFAIIGSVVFAFKRIYSTDNGKYQIDKFCLKLPVFGMLIQKVSVARFTRTFGTLIKSGVPILTALEITEDSSGNAVLARAVKSVKEEVKQGGSINAPLSKFNIFPPMVISMIAVGEETGELDSMLNKIADFYDTEVEAAVDGLTALIEPLMMVVLGSMVGAVLIGMYMPMFKMFDAIK